MRPPVEIFAIACRAQGVRLLPRIETLPPVRLALADISLTNRTWPRCALLVPQSRIPNARALMQYSRMSDPNNLATNRNQSWSRYWATGALHSCVGSFADNYDGQIAAFWNQVFARLPPAARVLDLATGNGALPRLLLESASLAHAQIDAVDLATIAPRWPQTLDPEQRARVRFQGGICAESLPFADASFDLVISQYGIEYTDLAASAVEARRVLADRGSIALLMHHAESLPVRLGRCELAELDWMEQPDGLLDAARALLPFLAQLGTSAGLARVRSDPLAAQTRAAVNQCMRELDQRADANADGAAILRETQANLAGLFNASAQLGAVHAQARLQALLAALAQARLRQTELVGCALDEAALHSLIEHLAGARRYNREISLIRVRGHLFGWGLQLRPQN